MSIEDFITLLINYNKKVRIETRNPTSVYPLYMDSICMHSLPLLQYMGWVGWVGLIAK